jgi:hypothetical protein
MINTLKNKVIIRNDKHLKFEYNNIFKKIFNLILVPTLNVLPVGSRKIISKSDNAVGEVVKNATNHKALEILYGNGKGSAKTIKNIYINWTHCMV